VIVGQKQLNYIHNTQNLKSDQWLKKYAHYYVNKVHLYKLYNVNLPHLNLMKYQKYKYNINEIVLKFNIIIINIRDINHSVINICLSIIYHQVS